MTLIRVMGLLAICGIAISGEMAQSQTASPPNQPTCHANGDYLVIGRERADDVGTAFLVRKPPSQPRPCEFKEEAGDYKIDDGEPYYFAGLAHKYLILTASTGAPTDLVIFDLSVRKRVLSRRLTDATPVIEDDQVKAVIRIGPGSAKACKDWARYKKDGGTGAIGAPSVFDLRTGKLTVGTARVCSYEG